MEKLEEGDQQVKLPKSCVKGNRAPGYTFQEAMDFLNGKENIALNRVTESVAELQGDRSLKAVHPLSRKSISAPRVFPGCQTKDGCAARRPSPEGHQNSAIPPF